MLTQTHRRLVVLALVAAVASVWAIELEGSGVAAEPAEAASSAALDAGNSAPPCPFPPALRGAFEAAARTTTLPPALLYAVAKVESNLRVDARSPAGARGVLQVMPETAASLALDVDQPRANILAGAQYLRLMLDRFGSADLALAAYNAGPTAVAKAGDAAPSAGVVQYVANVDAQWRSAAGCR